LPTLVSWAKTDDPAKAIKIGTIIRKQNWRNTPWMYFLMGFSSLGLRQTLFQLASGTAKKWIKFTQFCFEGK